MSNELKAPFPWFGGKSRVAHEVWARFGDTPNYVEPFAGSLAVLLGRPHAGKVETINDKDGFISNFWRAVSHDAAAVARYADHPVNEVDLHARHAWLLSRRDDFVARLMGDPDYYEVKIAGWWCWGLCCDIGSGWCSGKGPWQSVGGVFQKVGDARRGVNRQLPHLGPLRGVLRDTNLYAWFDALQARLSRVRVTCGDWSRVVTPSVAESNGITAVFLDPPYPSHDRAEVYTHDTGDVAYEVRDWAIANGDNPQLRIALCGYSGHWDMPDTWQAHSWKTAGGYNSRGNNTRGAANAQREMIWFSPHCINQHAELFS